MMTQLLNIAFAVDQLFNTLLFGVPDETLSSRAYRCGVMIERPKMRWRGVRLLIDSIFFFQSKHCFRAYQSEIERKHFVKSMRL